MSDLSELVSRKHLRFLAGERSFERGAAYLAGGRVTRLGRSRAHVEASVHGARRYRVELWVADGELGYSCTCPVGQGGELCKHCVAVGLALPESGESEGLTSIAISLDDVRDHLASLPQETLVEILVEEAREDERLLDRPRLHAASGGGGVDKSAFRDAIDRAVDTGGFVPYAGAYDYSRTLDETIDALENVLRQGHSVDAVELIEHCLSAIERTGGMVDDSDGYLGLAFDRLQRLHHDACAEADLDPVRLAERLFERMTISEYDLFYDAFKSYGPLLGAPGRRATRSSRGRSGIAYRRCDHPPTGSGKLAPAVSCLPPTISTSARDAFGSRT